MTAPDGSLTTPCRAALGGCCAHNAVSPANQIVRSLLIQMTVAVKNVAGNENVGGSAVYVPGGSAAGAPYGTLLGLPVVPIEQASTLGTAGDIMLADMSRYYYIAKNLKADNSIHVRFIYERIVILIADAFEVSQPSCQACGL